MFGFHWTIQCPCESRYPMRINRVVPIAVGVAVLIGIGGVAAAQIPSADGTISSCYTKSTGAIRILDGDSGSCKKGETSLTWNQHGNPGINGTNGTNGVSGYSIVTSDKAFGGGTFATVDVDCPAGKKVLGGGVSAVDEGTGRDVSTSALTINTSTAKADGSGWFAGIETQGGFPVTVRVRAQCATVTP